MVTGISNFQQLYNFLSFKWVLVGPAEGYPYAEGILLDFGYHCNCWNNSDLHTSMCIYHTDKTKGGKKF